MKQKILTKYLPCFPSMLCHNIMITLFYSLFYFFSILFDILLSVTDTLFVVVVYSFVGQNRSKYFSKHLPQTRSFGVPVKALQEYDTSYNIQINYKVFIPYPDPNYDIHHSHKRQDKIFTKPFSCFFRNDFEHYNIVHWLPLKQFSL